MEHSEYERTLDSAEYAKTVIERCFIMEIMIATKEVRIYLNYLNIGSIYYICYLICTSKKNPNIGNGLICYLVETDVEYIYKSFKAIAEGTYSCEVNSSLNEKSAHITWVPDDKSIPQWIFDIVANSINIMKP